MGVRAKFIVDELTKSRHGYHKVKLSAVNEMDEDNKDWSQYTPTGTIEMCITNERAIDQFESGQSFFVDFTPSDDNRTD